MSLTDIELNLSVSTVLCCSNLFIVRCSVLQDLIEFNSYTLRAYTLYAVQITSLTSPIADFNSCWRLKQIPTHCPPWNYVTANICIYFISFLIIVTLLWLVYHERALSVPRLWRLDSSGGIITRWLQCCNNYTGCIGHVSLGGRVCGLEKSGNPFFFALSFYEMRCLSTSQVSFGAALACELKQHWYVRTFHQFWEKNHPLCTP